MNEPSRGDADRAGRAGNPNAEGEQGLAGDMGVSSERTGPFEPDSVEGTGTPASAQGRTDGAEEPVADTVVEHRQVQEVEDNTATLRPHEDIRAANPHPHRDDEDEHG